ncbi:MAG: hydrogenase 4 subunit B [Elusimicrobia bacterium]|nr:hydrogenase 4 subunit B [Elusimicrobiota bacterium]
MNLLPASAACLALGTLACLLLRRSPVAARSASLGAALLGSGLMLAASAACLAGDAGQAMVLPGPLGAAGFSFRLDPFSALFCGLVSCIALAASVYGLSYASGYDEKAAALGAFYDLFLLAMALVPAADNAFSFLFAWEAMTLSSFFLVTLDHEKASSRRAGYLYFVMSQAGTALIFASFLILWRAAGSLEFAAFRLAGPALPAGAKSAVFLLALAGFGLKAGTVPLHIWLPYAHPAAPSHVSALMSGVMIKTGIYGILLTALGFLGGGPAWWGGLVLGLGAVSSVLGVLYALMEHDLKRLLAFHSVENIGIILMGLGAGMLFSSFELPELALAAYAAGLYHTVNHAVFKSLLFLGAGSVLKAVGTRDMEKMGGLIKNMPATALCFLVGSMAISALPPLNGFMSEWLTFQSLLSGFGLESAAGRLGTLTAAACLALTGGLAAACFVKAFGVTFLALPRSEEALKAVESPAFELWAMAGLAGSCLLLGIMPGPVLRLMHAGLAPLLPAYPLAETPDLAAVGILGTVHPAVLLGMLAGLAAAAWLAVRLYAGPARVRRAPTWACGMPGLTPRMEYTSTAFSKPIRLMFAFLYKPSREIRRERMDQPYFPGAIHYSTEITYVIRERLYRPSVRTMLRGAHLVRGLQAGSVNLYLGYLCATVTLLLIFLIGRAR